MQYTEYITYSLFCDNYTFYMYTYEQKKLATQKTDYKILVFIKKIVLIMRLLKFIFSYKHRKKTTKTG